MIILGAFMSIPPHKGTLSIYSYLHGGTFSLEDHNDHEKDVVMPTFLSLFLGLLISKELLGQIAQAIGFSWHWRSLASDL